MINPDLKKYITDALANKQPFASVQETLLQSGWTIDDIRQAMQEIQSEIKQSQTAAELPAELPLELRRWNWGAFFFTWIWGIANNVWISFLVFLPLVGFFVSIYLGINGSAFAWKNRHFQSIDNFIKVQREWAIWGFVFFVLSMLFYFAIIAFIFVSANFPTFKPLNNSSSYSNQPTANSSYNSTPTTTPSSDQLTFDQAINQMEKTAQTYSGKDFDYQFRKPVGYNVSTIDPLTNNPDYTTCVLITKSANSYECQTDQYPVVPASEYVIMLETNNTGYTPNMNGASSTQIGSGQGSILPSYTASSMKVTDLVSQAEYSFPSSKKSYTFTLFADYNTPYATWQNEITIFKAFLTNFVIVQAS